MVDYSFYTIMLNERFLNSNSVLKDTKNISQAIKFNFKKDAENYKDFYIENIDNQNYKVIRVDCKLEGVM